MLIEQCHGPLPRIPDRGEFEVRECEKCCECAGTAFASEGVPEEKEVPPQGGQRSAVQEEYGRCIEGAG
jgi:hypothetical protein